jgi:hypothetical protein
VVSIGWSSILSLFGEASVCVVSLMLIFRVWYCVSVESGNNFIAHGHKSISVAWYFGTHFSPRSRIGRASLVVAKLHFKHIN